MQSHLETKGICIRKGQKLVEAPKLEGKQITSVYSIKIHAKTSNLYQRDCAEPLKQHLIPQQHSY